MSLSKPAIGIDLGTTYSAVAVFRNGITEIIPNEDGNRITPSCVGFTQTERVVGEGAIYQAADNPENTIYGIKRLLGRKIDDEAIQNDIRSWPFKVMQDGSANAKIEVNFKGNRKTFFPEEISAAVLQKMKKTAENYLGTKIKDVVITCPAYFNNGQRQTTKDAAEIAGLNVLRLINEPTAAAMAYGLNVNHTDRKNLLIFDFGGGTFDVSIITIKDKKYIVRAVNGDTHLGGEDIDQRIVDYFVKEFKEKNNRDISGDKGLLRLLKTHCERAKKVLSGLSRTNLLLEGTDLKGQITRAKLEELNYDLFERTVELVEATLADAEMDKKEIDEVILVGGSSRIPKVREMITELFDGKILNQSINPDEAVALGAAVQAGILLEDGSSRLKGLKLTDVCPLSLGTKLHDGSFEVIIKRNTALPAKKSSKFYNAYDNQTTMDVEIYEGERFLAQDNHFLAEFKMSDIPPMDRATACIEDTYEIDANGILKVTATVLASGVTQSLTISDNSRTKPIDAKKLALDAEQFHEEDAKHQARLFALNAFETYVYHLKRLTRTLPVAKRAEATELLKKMEEWLGGNPHETKEKFETMKAKLETAWNQMQ